jgi:hypothetical protein
MAAVTISLYQSKQVIIIYRLGLFDTATSDKPTAHIGNTVMINRCLGTRGIIIQFIIDNVKIQ